MRKLYFSSFVVVLLLLLFGNSSAQDDSSVISIQKSDEEKVYKQSEVDQKAKIIKPQQHPLTDRVCNNDVGLVRVIVVLHKSGKVSDVKSLKNSECQRFNENSIDSAKKFKFNPAVKDGQPVSVSVMVEFRYRIF